MRRFNFVALKTRIRHFLSSLFFLLKYCCIIYYLLTWRLPERNSPYRPLPWLLFQFWCCLFSLTRFKQVRKNNKWQFCKRSNKIEKKKHVNSIIDSIVDARTSERKTRQSIYLLNGKIINILQIYWGGSSLVLVVNTVQSNTCGGRLALALSLSLSFVLTKIECCSRTISDTETQLFCQFQMEQIIGLNWKRPHLVRVFGHKIVIALVYNTISNWTIKLSESLAMRRKQQFTRCDVCVCVQIATAQSILGTMPIKWQHQTFPLALIQLTIWCRHFCFEFILRIWS